MKRSFLENYYILKKKSSKLWDKFLQWGHEKITIMFIPHNEKNIFNFQISKFTVYFFVLLFAGVISTFVVAQSNSSEVNEDEERLQMNTRDVRSQIMKYKEMKAELQDLVDELKPDIEEVYMLAAGNDNIKDIWNHEESERLEVVTDEKFFPPELKIVNDSGSEIEELIIHYKKDMTDDQVVISEKIKDGKVITNKDLLKKGIILNNNDIRYFTFKRKEIKPGDKTTEAEEVVKTITTGKPVKFRNTYKYSVYLNSDEIDYKEEKLELKKTIEIPEEVYQLKELKKDIIAATNTVKTIKNFVDVRSKVINDTPSIIPNSGHITSLFGWRRSPFGFGRDFHTGIDIAAPEGTPIHATAPGEAKMAGWGGGYGYRVVLKHKYGFETVYAHCNKLAIEPGDRVRKGQVVGYVGQTGSSTGNHCHYEVRLGGVAINPYPYMSRMW